MNVIPRSHARSLIVLLAPLTLAHAANAQLSMTWSTIDCGGGTATSPSLRLRFTIGQHAAAQPMTGGTLSLTGGFWAGAAQLPCSTSDFDGDQDYGTDADIHAFFACLGGDCCDTCYAGGADFNADGDYGTDADIESFFRVLGGGAC